jgi:hypothetical protein
MKLYHGSPCLFDHFELTDAGDGTGLKYGYAVYLTEVEATAVHYSQPRKQEFAEKGDASAMKSLADKYSSNHGYYQEAIRFY